VFFDLKAVETAFSHCHHEIISDQLNTFFELKQGFDSKFCGLEEKMTLRLTHSQRIP